MCLPGFAEANHPAAEAEWDSIAGLSATIPLEARLFVSGMDLAPKCAMTNPKKEASATEEPESRDGFEAVSQLGTEARGLASEVASSAQELVRTEVEKRTAQGAEELSEVAQALRQSGRALKGNRAAPYVQKAADGIEHVADYVRQAKPRDVLETVTTFAKRDPVLFLSGAFAVGLLGSRFMKSGANPDYGSSDGRATVSK